MRSFHLPSLVFCVFLLSYPSTQARYSIGHEKHHVRPRHNKPHNTFVAKYKRAENAPLTNFADGPGACGITNGPNDFIVALNSAEYDGGAHCFEMITITVNGKTAQAQITDECPGCGPGGLDLSNGLFLYFAPLDEGELYGSWYFNSDMTSSSSTPAPTPSYTPPTTTTFSSSSTAPSTTITTSAASTVTSSTSNPSTVPTSTPQDPQVIAQFDLALLEIGTLLQVSFKLQI
ncbi:RlpA-like double-psi beta-barrel-containing domain containing protein [Tylopilus felleus]